MINVKLQITKSFRAILIIGLLVILYFSLRLPNLTLQPIFTDEAIYIRWAQVMRAEPTLRFVSLTDGKTPLFMWMMIPLFKIFNDPLFAGRFLSVVSGLFTLAGVLFLGWKFFGKGAGLWAAFLYAVVPYFVFFDRMALVDSMLAAFSIWALNLALLLIKFPRLDLAMGLGYLLGGGILVKTPGFFNIVSLPFTIVAFNFLGKDRPKRFVRLLLLWMVAILISLAIYNILRLGPGFSSLSSRNEDYVRSPQEVLMRPWDPFIPHVKDISAWSLSFIGIPVLLLFLFGIIESIKHGQVRKITLAVLFFSLVPLFIQTSFLKTFTARYILFSLPPLLVLAGFGIDKILVRLPKLWLPLLMTVLIWPSYFNYYLLINPEKAPLATQERQGYFEMWTAGHGLKEIAQFLNEKSRESDIVVGTEGSFGTLPDGLQIYIDKNRKIAVVPGGATVSADLRMASLDHPTYFVANKSRYFNYQERIKLIKEYPKAKPLDGSQDAMLFFEVFPLEATSSSDKK